jgi:hypothetical protein
VGQFFLTQFSKSGLRPRFEKAKLGFGQDHFGTDLVLILFMEVEAREDFTIPVRQLLEDPLDQVRTLLKNSVFFRISVRVRDSDRRFHIDLLAADMDNPVNVSSDLTPHDSSDESHQPLRVAKLAATYGLDYHDKRVMDLVVQLLGPQLTAKLEPNALGKELIQFLHPIGFT